MIALNGNNLKTEKLKQCMRIWSGFTKLIRSQCTKDRIIDSIYLGTYYKLDDSFHFINTIEEDKELPAIQKEHVALNIQGIAEVCGC